MLPLRIECLQEAHRMPTVIVVGAGYAGLGAAATLAQSGVLDLRIVILEGSDRVRLHVCLPSMVVCHATA